MHDKPEIHVANDKEDEELGDQPRQYLAHDGRGLRLVVVFVVTLLVVVAVSMLSATRPRTRRLVTSLPLFVFGRRVGAVCSCCVSGRAAQ